MHMADALVSPAVGATLWVATGATTFYCAKKVREQADAAKVPLMGVAGAFVFAAQMLNFTIPGTGSSGHLGGGLILAILLGPEAAFLVMASVLTVQALFFADGGLLALGCNIMNLGFFPAFVAYPLIYKPLAGDGTSRARLTIAALVAGIVALQLGALGVVLQTTLSGVSELPFSTFMTMMLPIHLAIGVVEGLVTSGVVLFLKQAQPELLERNRAEKELAGLDLRPVLFALATAALVLAFVLAQFASSNPDGLEWSIEKVTGSAELAAGATARIHDAAAALQEKTAIMPGYAPKEPSASAGASPATPSSAAGAQTGIAGLVGAAITIALAVVLGAVLARRRRGRDGGATKV